MGELSFWNLLNRALSLGLLASLAPLLLFFAVAIQLHGRGPVFFAQTREGKGGRPFRLWKLRTMVVDAEVRLAEQLGRNPTLAEEWRRFGCLREDPRIAGTAGRLARELSVDEVPQLWNVLRGEMSLVGPRPLITAMASSLRPCDRSVRNLVLPGLTGLWQIRGRSDVDLRGMQRYDKLYVRKRHMRLDLWILFRTPAAILSRRGALAVPLMAMLG